MNFGLLEGGAVVLALLVAMEMRREHRSWRSALIGSLVVLAIATIMIAMWRGR